MSLLVEVTKSDRIAMHLRKVKFSQIQLNAPLNAFREGDELKPEAVADLADHMAAHGLTTPWLVLELDDDKYLGGDCHRRWHAFQHNIDRGVAGFTLDTEVPAHVLPKGTPDLAFVHMALGSNEHRQNLSDIGKIKAAIRLKSLGETNKAIAEALRTSERTVSRWLLLGGNPYWMREVRRHNIKVTAATDLLAAATEAERVLDFQEAYKAWFADTKDEIAAEVQRRLANDEPALSLAEQEPQKWLTPAQKSAWIESLKSGGELGAPDVTKYRAGVTEGPGPRVLAVDAIKLVVDTVSAKHAAKLAARFADVAQDLEQIAREKKAAEEARRQGAEAAGERPSERLLREFGLDQTAEDDDGDGPESKAEAEAPNADAAVTS